MENNQRMGKRLRYLLDNLYSKGTAATIASLALLSLIIVLISAAILVTGGLAPGTSARFEPKEAFWLTLLGILGEGSIGGRESAWGYRFLMLGVSLGSIFVMSSLIGLISNGMRNRLEFLHKGRSDVVENGHIVILGWCEQIFTILQELLIANASEKRACIVILGQKDKQAMEEEIGRKVNRVGRTRIVCRTGNPMDMADLSIVSINTARSIVVLSPESINPDADVIKVILAITNHPKRRKEPYKIVAGIRQPKNNNVAQVAGKDEVEWLRMGDIVARIIAQACRQSGLSAVYDELLNFRGSEVYLHQEPGLAGVSFGEAQLASEKEVLIGLVSKGIVRLNPDPEVQIEKEDQLIVIAPDNTQIHFAAETPPSIRQEAISIQPDPPRHPEHTLILGWNWRGTTIIQELDYYVAPGSTVQVVADRQGVTDDLARDCHNLRHLEVCYQHADTTDRHILENLGLENYHHVILLSYSDRLPTQQSDAQSLMTLLHLRDISVKHNLHYSIVSEMLDARNRNLAKVTQADDFIVSDHILSLIMAQVLENQMIHKVFQDLFDPSGSELYLKPACQYVRSGQPVDFYTVSKAASQRKEIAVGYRLLRYASDPRMGFGVKINPLKTEEITFRDEDCLIVLAKY